jgi:NitT/TauT family transport system substrate-binding protein
VTAHRASGFLKNPLRLGLACLLAALVAVPAGSSSPSATHDGDQLRKVNVAIIAVDATAQVMFAKHRGFFAKQGIDAELTVVGDGTLTVPALLSGQAQFAAVPVAVLAILRSRNAPVKAVAGGAVYEPGVPTTVLVAAPGKRISRARDLVGKRIGLDSLYNISHIALQRWLARGGVSPEDVDIATLPFAQMIPPLVHGQLDAAWLPEPWATQALQRGARTIAYPFDAVCSQDCLLTVYIAQRNVDPDLAARFRNAVQAAAVWANRKRNQAASGRILGRYAPVDAKVLEKMTRIAYATRLRPRSAQPWIDLFAEYKLIPESFSATDLVK